MAPVTRRASLALSRQKEVMPNFRALMRKEWVPIGGHREYEECVRNREHLIWQVKSGQISAQEAEWMDRMPGEEPRRWSQLTLSQLPDNQFPNLANADLRVYHDEGCDDVTQDDAEESLEQAQGLGIENVDMEIEEEGNSLDSEITVQPLVEEPKVCESPEPSLKKLADTAFAVPQVSPLKRPLPDVTLAPAPAKRTKFATLAPKPDNLFHHTFIQETPYKEAKALPNHSFRNWTGFLQRTARPDKTVPRVSIQNTPSEKEEKDNMVTAAEEAKAGRVREEIRKAKQTRQHRVALRSGKADYYETLDRTGLSLLMKQKNLAPKKYIKKPEIGVMLREDDARKAEEEAKVAEVEEGGVMEKK